MPACSRSTLVPLLALCALCGSCRTFGFGSRPVPVEREVHTTASGLGIVDLVPGSGTLVIHGSKVMVHYTARLQGGEVFDSSYERGVPQGFTIGAGEVISGWEEGMLAMRPGGRRRIVVPPDRAYGAEGVPGTIPPDSTIELEVELIAVEGP